MSNFFEQELRRLFGDGEIIQAPKFVGRACLGELGGDLQVRAEFITTGCVAAVRRCPLRSLCVRYPLRRNTFTRSFWLASDRAGVVKGKK